MQLRGQTEIGHGSDGPGKVKGTAPTFHDETLWQAGSKWTCIAGPVLHWMIGKPYHEVSRYIERKGWRVIWG
jgi:hypothetical protein